MTLSGYVLRLFLVRFGVMLLLLVTVLQMLDLLSNADEIMADPAADRGTLWRYVMLRVPQLIDLFTPFAALLGAMVTLAQLNQNSEVTVMRAAGLSAHRILFPIGLACLAIALVHFVFQESVVVGSTKRLAYWERNGFALDLGPAPELRSDVWVNQGRTIIRADTVSRSGSRVILDDVTIYLRGPDELLQESRTADFAWHDADGWKLFGVRDFSLEALSMEVRETERWDLDIPPERFLSGIIEPNQTPMGDLAATIAQLRREGADVRALRTAQLSRLAGPLGSLIMPLMAAVVGFGSLRAGRLFVRVIIGMAMGFGFFVVQNFMLAMGELGTAPPSVAAFAPVAFFLLVGYAAVFILEE